MSRPCVIVYERHGMWAAALKRQLPREVRVRETRVLADCQAELAASPGSLVIAELSRKNWDPLLQWISRLNDSHATAAVAVVAPRDMANAEALFREAGALHFAISPRACAPLAHIAMRHLERTPAARLTLAAQVWEWLPWE